MEQLITAEVTIRAVVEIPLRRFRLLQIGDKHEHDIMTKDLKHRLNAFHAEVQELFDTKPTPVPTPEEVAKVTKKVQRALDRANRAQKASETLTAR